MRGRSKIAWAFATLAGLAPLGHGAGAESLRFDFNPADTRPGWIAVAPDMVFSTERGFGFEAGAVLERVPATAAASVVTSAQPFYFTARVPVEGNYRVSVKVGHPTKSTDLTIKAELRRLMVERMQTARGEFVTRSFIVNVRSHHITARNGIADGIVRLKAPRETTQEAWAWDDLLTLEFNGAAPAVHSVEIASVDVPTIFLIGDSTVCDQSREPFNSWGQMLPAFFTGQVAIANHGESGETYRDSIGRRRLDKIISVMKPGDWLIMQFGHNDQKQIASGTGGPFTTYQDEMRQHIAAVRKVGGTPVVVSPMERRGFDESGHVRTSLADYAKASREVAEKESVAFIDLNAMSRVLYESLGPERSALAFAAPDGKVDNTHHNNYGSYQLARCIVQGIRDAKLEIAQFIEPEVATFDPSQPDVPETFAVPSSPIVTSQRPLGD